MRPAAVLAVGFAAVASGCFSLDVAGLACDVDEEVVVLSVPGGRAIESLTYARGLVFRDLLVVTDPSVAAAFVEVHRQLWSEAVPLAELRKLCDPTGLLAEVRCGLRGE